MGYQEVGWQRFYAIAIVVFAMLFLWLVGGNLAQAGQAKDAAFLQTAAGIFLFFISFGILTEFLNVSGLGGKPQLDLDIFGRQSGFKSAVAFLFGFILFLFWTASQQNVVNFTGQSVFTQAADVVAQSNPSIAAIITTVAAPIAEEYFFLIAAPLLVFIILNRISKSIPALAFLDNLIIKVGLAIVISAFTFAGFHVSRAEDASFFFAALVFRTILLGLSFGDRIANILPWVDAGLFFAIGAHMANNINSIGGLMPWLDLMSKDIFGLFVLAFLALNVLQLASTPALSRVIPRRRLLP